MFAHKASCEARSQGVLPSLLQTEDSNGDLDPGVLLTAQTITSETTSSTTTTQITKVTGQPELPSGTQWHVELAISVQEGPQAPNKDFLLHPY